MDVISTVSESCKWCKKGEPINHTVDVQNPQHYCEAGNWKNGTDPYGVQRFICRECKSKYTFKTMLYFEHQVNLDKTIQTGTPLDEAIRKSGIARKAALEYLRGWYDVEGLKRGVDIAACQY
jgi:hypothetical protein